MPDTDQLIDWMIDTASHATGLYGRFPVPEAQVIAVPVRGMHRTQTRPREAVPFARVLRDGGNAVQFFVDQTRADADFRADWTATHEFSHLLLPFVTMDGAWITEGFASYYQEVLRARAGWIDPGAAWQRLREGFERGGGRDYRRTLDQAMRSGGPNRTRRMYWTGAAIALMADVELRRRSRGEVSLDTVLDALSRCCLPARRDWRADELVARLDELAGMEVIAPLRDRWLNSRVFPDWQTVYADLGIELRSASVRLGLPDAAGIRTAIMQPRDDQVPSPAGVPVR